MKEKIKQIAWYNWILFFLLSVGLFILLNAGIFRFFDIHTINPWTNANEVGSKIAIETFSDGTAGDVIYSKQRFAALAGILLYLIIGPGILILFGINSSKEEQTEEIKSGNLTGFVIGFVITVMGIIPMGLEAVISPIVHENSRTSASQSAKKDEIRNHLLLLAQQSYEYLVLPEKQGGGGDSFKGLDIENLPAYKDIEKGQYRFVNTDSDTLLHITGTGTPEYKADAGDTEKVTLSVEVRPSDITNWIDE